MGQLEHLEQRAEAEHRAELGPGDYDCRLAAYAVVVDPQARVLLALWNESDILKWTMPGGGVEFAETVEQAVVRELREETGYDIEISGVLGVDTFIQPAHRRRDLPGTTRPLKNIRVLFRGGIVGGELRNEVGGTTDEARWIPLVDVPDLPRVSLVDAALTMYLDSTPGIR